MIKFSCFCAIFALPMLLGCHLDDSTKWLHPRQCAIKNETNRKMETVELDLVLEKWQIVPISLLPGETKVVALPEGKIPNMVTLSWDESRQGHITSLMSLDSIDLDYTGDILFTIYDMNHSRPKVETVDLSKLGIKEEEVAVPNGVQESAPGN